MGRRVLQAVVLAACSMAVVAQPTHSLRTDEAPTGSRIRSVATAGARYPLDKPYERFSPEERAALKSRWEHIAEDDEPPFPAGGMKSLVLEFRTAAAKRQAVGITTLVAHVSPEGKVTKVDVLASVDDQLTRFIGWHLGNTKFKPAICAGQPCSMQFPMSFKFSFE